MLNSIAAGPLSTPRPSSTGGASGCSGSAGALEPAARALNFLSCGESEGQGSESEVQGLFGVYGLGFGG